MFDEGYLAKVIKKALSKGGDFADIYIEHSMPTTIHFEDNKPEKVITGIEAGVGVRVIFGEKSAYAYSNDLSEKSLIDLADTVSNAVQREDGNIVIALRKKKANIDYPIKLMPRDVPMERKIALVEDANRVARAIDRRIRQVSAIYRDTIQRVKIVTSDGFVAEDERIYTLALVQVVASEGDVIQTGYEPIGGLIGFELFEENPFDEVALKAAKKAAMLLGAMRIHGGRMPVVISSDAGGTMIHEAIGHGLEADLAQQGISVYSGKIGQRIASSAITVIDDATLPNKRGSFRFDDEGVAAQRTVLVEDGILKRYMYDRLTAMKDGVRSTGNGRRESYQHRPIPRMTNTFIAPKDMSPDEIIRSVETGLFVKKMGGGQVNTVTGDFVFEVSEGYLIERGQVGEPVRGATLTGNGPQILMSIDMAGSDLGFSIGTCGKDGQGVPVSDAMPTIRIPEMVVGGKV